MPSAPFPLSRKVHSPWRSNGVTCQNQLSEKTPLYSSIRIKITLSKTEIEASLRKLISNPFKTKRKEAITDFTFFCPLSASQYAVVKGQVPEQSSLTGSDPSDIIYSSRADSKPHNLPGESYFWQHYVRWTNPLILCSDWPVQLTQHSEN